MKQYQSISITYPKMHGNGPRNLAMAIRMPRAPQPRKKFKSLKEAMEYVKSIKEEDNEDKE